MPVGDVGEYRDDGCEFQPWCMTCSLPKCILEMAAVGIQRLYEYSWPRLESRQSGRHEG